MNKIHKLPEHVIQQIAAGEVIERPAFAVKELIENAIDAKATVISISVEQAGLKKITVTDNGESMSKADLLESFKPHTTSKIEDEQDLVGIKSLGFRGEALASIAAISQLIIQSRRKQDIGGTKIEINHGKLQNVSPIGMPQGTTVIVERLFANVPARRKILKTLSTEFRHITDIVMHYALLFPDIQFSLFHNGKQVLLLPKNINYVERLKLLFGSSIVDQFVKVDFSDGYISISGFLAKPQVAATSQNKQYIFVNNRKVIDKLISQAVKDAFSNLLSKETYPVFILFIQMPYEAVDVNVHPQKMQVRFLSDQTVFDNVYKSVKETLEKFNLTFHSINIVSEKGKTNSYAAKKLRQQVLDNTSLGKINLNQILQTHNLYLIFQTENGVVIIDQHAAHERVLYEKLKQAFEKHQKEQNTYILPEAVTFEVSLNESQMLNEHKDYFTKLGFTIDNFSGTTFRVSEVPKLFQDRDVKQLIQELIEYILENRTNKIIDSQTDTMLMFLACRAAVKAGNKLNKEQVQELIKQLDQTPNNTTCPHGRPTRIELTLEQLHKYFKRR